MPVGGAGTTDAIGGTAAAGAAVAFQGGLDHLIETLNQNLQDAARSGAPKAVHGFLAEQWHAGTFNIDAYKKGLWDLVATAPDIRGPGTVASPDVVIERGGQTILNAQLKYYRNAVETAKQLWNPRYSDGAKVAPSDQVQGVIDASRQKALLEAGTRPDVADAARHSAANVSDRVAVGGAESKPLTHGDAREATRQARQGQDVASGADFLSPGEIARKTALGGAIGAGIGFVLGSAPHILRAIKKWRSDQGISDEEFASILKQAGKGGASQAAWSGLQGVVATALVHLAATGRLGDLLGQVGPGPIGAIAVVVVQSLRDGLAWYEGEIDGAEFARRCSVTGVVAAAGVAGATIGQGLIPIPVVGALIGSVVGSIVGRVGAAVALWAFDHIAPYIVDAVDSAARVLFQWDLIQEARAQSTALDARFTEVLDAASTAEQAQFRAFRELRLPPIDVAALAASTRQQRAALEQMEGSWQDT